VQQDRRNFGPPKRDLNHSTRSVASASRGGRPACRAHAGVGVSSSQKETVLPLTVPTDAIDQRRIRSEVRFT